MDMANERNFDFLYAAVSRKDLLSARSYLESVVDINQIHQKTGLTIVHVACMNKDATMLALLLTYKPDVNMKVIPGELMLEMINFIQKTALYIAVYNSDIISAHFLLKYGVDMNSEPSILFTTTQTFSKEIIELLLKYGANPNCFNDNGCTPLLYYIIEKLSLDDTSQQSSSDRIEYHITKTKIVKVLLECGADPNTTDINTGLAPLQAAIGQGFVNIVKTLLKFNANVNHSDDHGSTALHYAVTYNCPQLMNLTPRCSEFLPHTFVNTTFTDSDMIIKMIEILLDSNADINSIDNEGKTPLAIACKRGVYDIIIHLLARKADTNIKDLKGKTPLHEIMETELINSQHKLKIIKALLDHNADINAVDNHGQTPLAIAVKKCFKFF